MLSNNLGKINGLGFYFLQLAQKYRISPKLPSKWLLAPAIVVERLFSRNDTTEFTSGFVIRLAMKNKHEGHGRKQDQRKMACWLTGLFCVFGISSLSGCGTTTQRVGTEQLLMSDAVDQAIAQIDFQSLTDQKVFLDSKYIETVRGIGFVNAPYIISSLRQQLTAHGCLLQDDRKSADIIVEARVGALGTDGHEVIYGVPNNNLLSSASAVISNAPPIPAIPEISAARIDAQSGIAKILVFAYDSKTRKPIWQSGVAKAESTSRNSWILGAGPFQKGTVHDGTRFAGEKFQAKLPSLGKRLPEMETGNHEENSATYFTEHQFSQPQRNRDTTPSAATATKVENNAQPSRPLSPSTRVATKPEDTR